MNIKRILCPVDFSEFNQAANEYASMLASATGAKIIYLHTYLPEPTYAPPALFDIEAEERRLMKKLEKTYMPTIKQIVASYAVEFGPAAERIIEFAQANEVDMIVIGTHGRTGLRRFIMGSVAEAVVRTAECPVLAIKTESKVLQKS